MDTVAQNGIRDHAQWAWIPGGGETCAFCLMLASRGWTDASKNVLKGNHAEHIHNNCDCTFAIRFDDSMDVEGYDPDEILERFDNVDGDSWTDKVNAMRREMYPQIKDARNARRRELYSRKSSNDNPQIIRIPQIPASTITEKVRNGEYSLQLSQQQYNKHVRGTKEYSIYESSRKKKGYGPQSRLLITYDETQRIIENYSGTGIIKTRKNGEPLNIEMISCDQVIGEYYQHGQWYSTNRARIDYGKNGAHLIPIKGNNYD